MRKLIASILAVIIMVLSCIPCSDVVAANSAKGGVSAIQKASQHNHPLHAAGDLCSPFCTCSCCAGFALPLFERVVLHPLPLYAQSALDAYRPQSPVEVHLPIWQPPQLG